MIKKAAPLPRLPIVLLVLGLAGCATFDEWFDSDRSERQPDLQFYTLPAAAASDNALVQYCNGVQLQIAARVMDWASAWQSRHFQEYAAFYVPEYRSRAAETHVQWAESTKKLIEGSAWARIEAEDIQASCEGQTAIAKFKINYRTTSALQRTARIKMIFVQRQGQWLIQSEQRDPAAIPIRQRPPRQPMVQRTREGG